MLQKCLRNIVQLMKSTKAQLILEVVLLILKTGIIFLVMKKKNIINSKIGIIHSCKLKNQEKGSLQKNLVIIVHLICLEEINQGHYFCWVKNGMQ